MAEKVVITSLGVISALGYGVTANLQALQAGRSGIGNIRYLQTVHANDFLIGEVKRSNAELIEMMGLDANKAYTRTTLLAFAAFKELLKGIDISLLKGEPFAFINANTVGGMCSVEDMYLDFLSENPSVEHVKYIDTLDCAESTLNIAKHFDLQPLMATISTACSSSANSLILGARMIKQGMVQRAICGGCDAMSRFTLNGFNTLKNVDKELCRPFDQNRMGLNLGEGAGYLLLESESAAKARGATIIAELSGYSNTNDAYHPTAPAPDGSGAVRTMKQALDKAGLQPSDIGYINAHGTATQNNDAAEGKAIAQLFAGNIPAFSSTKPFTGHTLAAAGSIEAIFTILALQNNMALPNLNFETPMEELSIKPVTNAQDNNARHALSNSFGFGGSNVSLVFSKA
ncbi:MAG: beta-ketoacyl-[acyl-carrier-protein] synthase family protein [Sphingobacteriales bacterium]|nr:MAG: beta-ketoacyl-[acyl-carrier-protein] synthase family protein [Sphingobacteriales bacterium]